MPDAKTIWAFKERLHKSGREKELFNIYTETLEHAGLITRQIDRDARFARKRGKTYYGYKNHIKVDADSKLIMDYLATSADRHDGKEAPNILDEKDQAVYMDACYRGREIEAKMRAKAPQAQLHIVRKHDGYYAPT